MSTPAALTLWIAFCLAIIALAVCVVANHAEAGDFHQSDRSHRGHVERLSPLEVTEFLPNRYDLKRRESEPGYRAAFRELRARTLRRELRRKRSHE